MNFKINTLAIALWVSTILYSGIAVSQNSNDVLLPQATEPSPSQWQLLFQLDNDLFADSDRDYTSGVRFGVVQEVPVESAKGRRWEKRLKDSSRKLTGRLQQFGFDEDSQLRFARGFGLSQLLFTPEDPTALSAPEGERPYASWLGLEYSFHVKEDDHVNSLTLSVGTTGEASFGQQTQNWVHRNISNSPIFQGWDSQVPSELTVNLHYDHKQRFRKFSKITSRGLELDGYYEGGFAAGNFRTDTYIGGLARIGYRLPSSFSTPRVQLGSYGHQLFRSNENYDKRFSAFGFLGVRATAVLHDITLDGPVFRDFDTGVKSKPLVGEVIYGLGFRIHGIAITYSHTFRSDEFANQSENIRFGSVMARFRSTFR